MYINKNMFPLILSKLSNVVYNYVVKKSVYDQLVTKVANSSKLVLTN